MFHALTQDYREDSIDLVGFVHRRVALDIKIRP